MHRLAVDRTEVIERAGRREFATERYGVQGITGAEISTECRAVLERDVVIDAAGVEPDHCFAFVDHGRYGVER